MAYMLYHDRYDYDERPEIGLIYFLPCTYTDRITNRVLSYLVTEGRREGVREGGKRTEKEKEIKKEGR